MRRIHVIISILVIIGLDQGSKYWVWSYFQSHPQPLEVTPFFNLVLTFNRGISFSLFSSESPLMYGLLTGVIFLLIGGIMVWLSRETATLSRFALSCILGGALGNAIDRLAVGAVIDFLDFFWQNYHWPAFNIADTFIFIGVALMLLYNFKSDTTKR